ncbi:ABC transporter permease [Corallococcus sp. BB11-1]|uniref:ABC transporter permease n=1 Tax=Corallococcus sp. BB11-1 TaxID=2996783 RepID=UPI00226DC80B|nr:ABC transporter permease [Corallococcus sp. BB11-1]MCY1034365.1 ABC transporter permease [Corallococcus sp. BB11-1]
MHGLFLAELRRSWALSRRYPGEMVTMLVSLVLVFLMLFWGVRYVAGPGPGALGDRLDGLIVGYFLWSVAALGLNGVGWAVQGEAAMGTLEQLFLSPFGPARVFLARVAADLVVQLGVLLTVLGSILIITGRTLALSPGVVPVMVTVVLAAWGLGFALGGLALRLKRIPSLLQLSQYGLLFLVTTPWEDWGDTGRWVGAVAPLAPGAGLLRGMMARGEPLEMAGFAIAALNGLAWLGLGLFLFHLAERHVRRGGGLAGY